MDRQTLTGRDGGVGKSNQHIHRPEVVVRMCFILSTSGHNLRFASGLKASLPIASYRV